MKQSRTRHNKRRMRYNPSTIGLHGDTYIMTKFGPTRVADLYESPAIEIWTGANWDFAQFDAGLADIYRVTLYDGSYELFASDQKIELANHRIIAVNDVQPGHKVRLVDLPIITGDVAPLAPYLKGFLLGTSRLISANEAIVFVPHRFGGIDRLFDDVDQATVLAVDETEKNVQVHLALDTTLGLKEFISPEKLPDEVFEWRFEDKTQFLAGIFDYGSMSTRNRTYRIDDECKSLLASIQLFLKTLDIPSMLEDETRQGHILRLNRQESIDLARMVDFSEMESVATDDESKARSVPYNRVEAVEQIASAELVYFPTTATKIALASRQICMFDGA